MPQPSRMQFPDQSAILIHLEKHPKSKNAWLKSQGILALAAKAFAHQTKTPTEIKKGVVNLLHHSPLNFTEQTIALLSQDLAIALRACTKLKSRL